MAYRYLPCSNIQYHFWNKERTKTWRSIAFCKIYHLLLKCSYTAYTTSKNNTSFVRINIVFMQTCVSKSLVANNKSKLCKPIDFAGFLAIEKFSWIKSFYFTGKACLEF